MSYRCSTASRAAGEDLAGTASTVRAFLLVEAPGPWGHDAVRASRLPEEVRGHLGGLERASGVRPLMIRRPGRHRRPPGGGLRAFIAYAGPGATWTAAATLEDPRELLDLDVTGLADATDAAGRGSAASQLPGFVTHGTDLYLVCAHGRHDACCAERGRPLAAALAAVAPEETWEVSHIGGCRFAANVLVLPSGRYYGRLEPADVEEFVSAHREGEVDLEHLRGRTAYPFAVQTAELMLRRQLGEGGEQALPLVSQRRTGGTERVAGTTTAVFSHGEEHWRVRVDTTREEPRLLTCRATTPASAPRHRLFEVSAEVSAEGSAEGSAKGSAEGSADD